MQKKIYLYLFLFAALIALYLAFSGNRRLASSVAENRSLETRVTQLEDSLEASRLEVLDMQYFSLENNDDALAYYDHLELSDPARYIADKLLETNEPRGDNPLVPYEGMENDFKINKIKVLNHRWILADFSDGKFWGELLIEYYLKDDLGIDFTVLDHFLYTRSDQ
ncbi:hydrolase [Robiginitalea sp. SC105]|uniref:hydrolase n=1 Tax=Robiginitalea sp. SC105 TaxID=2762332 RepID=UPI001639B2A9|nr:hydrolase [Robiginitalea sp. SC105]MBC2840660.1 hydrolase [Robiginitalea sp. SC105]